MRAGLAANGVVSLHPPHLRHLSRHRAWSSCRSLWRCRPACVAGSLCFVAPLAAPAEAARGAAEEREGGPRIQLSKWAVAAWLKGARAMTHAARVWGNVETSRRWCPRYIDVSKVRLGQEGGGGCVQFICAVETVCCSDCACYPLNLGGESVSLV